MSLKPPLSQYEFQYKPCELGTSLHFLIMNDIITACLSGTRAFEISRRIGISFACPLVRNKVISPGIAAFDTKCVGVYSIRVAVDKLIRNDS